MRRVLCAVVFVAVLFVAVVAPTVSTQQPLNRLETYISKSMKARRNREMIAIVWQFDTKPGKEDEFEQFYGAAGDWTAVNRHSRSYVGTSFLRDQVESSRYVVIEYWSEMVVYEEHKAYRGDELDRLAARRAELVRSFEPLGVFTVLDVPDRTGAAWSRRS